MSNKFLYKSDSYDRQTQRFVIPLYIKDNLGNYEYSSTGTLVKYNEHHYIIFAAHALSNILDISNIYMFYNNATFEKVQELSIGHQVFDKDDIVIIDFFNNAFDGKNYYNLNINNLYGFDKKHFAWTGFPVSKARKIHNKKPTDVLQKDFTHSDNSGKYFTNIKYYTIVSKIISNNKDVIKGKYNRSNVNLKYKGDVPMATHPKGMSGGAMYFFSKGQKLKESLDDTFRFAGIGIEYHEKTNTIIGVSCDRIIQILDKFDKENPLQVFPSNDLKCLV